MALPLTDSALVGTCLAFAALGLIAMTSGGGKAPAPAPIIVQAAPAPAAPVAIDDAFGAQVRAYLLANPEVIFEAVAEYERRNQAAQANVDQALVEAHFDALFNDGFSWEGGNPDGDIVMVEFMDYKCGFCKRAHAEVNAFLEADGNVRFILKEFPILGPESELASRFAIAVHQVGGNDAYAMAHDVLMTNNDPITPELLDSISQDLGLDLAELREVMGSEGVNDILTANRNLAQMLQISGTPTFVMNTEFIRGFVPASGLAEIAATLRE
ncbi:MAG: DsbA family protein [Roseinatronobacter sp.]